MKIQSILAGLSLVLTTASSHAGPVPTWQRSPSELKAAVSGVRAGADLTPDTWPQGARIAVGLSFDVDTELVWLSDGESQSPSTMSRGEYGARVGLRRILKLLASHGISATFFVPAMSMEIHPEIVPMIQENPRHEIGFHSYAHESPLALSAADERAAYQKGLEIFISRVGTRPEGFRSAAWDLTPASIGIVTDLGFAYDSSMMADDRPYTLISDGTVSRLVELPVEWILDDWPYFQLDWESGQVSMRNPDDVYSIWRSEFEVAYDEGTMFILTMHPQVIGHRNRIRMLDRLIEYMQSKPGVWFATHGQIAAYARASADPPDG